MLVLGADPASFETVIEELKAELFPQDPHISDTALDGQYYYAFDHSDRINRVDCDYGSMTGDFRGIALEAGFELSHGDNHAGASSLGQQ